MLAFLLEVDAWTRTGSWYPFMVLMVWIWLLWLLRIVLSADYRPYRAEHQATTSVIIPVVDEPPEVFGSVLDRIVEQQPTEVIVVINGPRNIPLEQVCDRAGVAHQWTRRPGKRNALRVGLTRSTGDIVVLVDSDTIWTDSTLPELIKPFADPQVGGVTTRQRILAPGRNVLVRWADWLENIRNEYSMPAMSTLGTVGCLPGRTIAFRRGILVDNLHRFLTERFLGTFLEVSDDRTLTNYTLMAGYHTVYQSTALVYTDAPTNLRKLVKQQYRWARGSQYNTLRMLPWMVRHTPVLAVMYVSDVLVPFFLLASVVSWGISISTGNRESIYGLLRLPLTASWQRTPVLLAIAGGMTMASASLRFARHFATSPADLRRLPMYMFINTFLLVPIRVLGFVRMAHDSGWGTRSGGYAGDGRRDSRQLIPYLLGCLILAALVYFSVR